MDGFVKLVKQNYSESDLILKAYDFACEAHKKEKRKSGEPYIVHPIAVATILIDMGLDKETISAALLHDVVEDTNVSFKKIKEEFGPEVEKLVKGVSKISGIKYDKPEVKEMNSLRRLFISMSKDIRVILIKIADRLHNIRTVSALKYDRQIRFCTETMDIFVPIAERLGLNSFKNEMEDICFSVLKPKEYNKLKDELDRKYEKTKDRMAIIEQKLKQLLVDYKIEGKISSRFKHFYSLFKKMRDRGTAKIYDVIAFRILVDKVEDCYRLLGLVHKLYKPVPGRVKDYIAAPKANGYKSLHTTVVTKDGTPFEVQMRTYAMHEYSEYGIAAHWRYKSGDNKQDLLDDRINWVRSIIEDEKQIKDSENFVKALQMDFSTTEICVFTPKYKPVSLPENATPIDFAYNIHTDLGDTCESAKVNGKKVPLNYKLETGDVVEIITSKHSKGPSRDWLKIAVSSNARTHIRNFFKKSIVPMNVIAGKIILEKKAEEFGVPIGNCLSGKTFEEVKRKYLIYSFDDMFSSIATGGIKALDLINIALSIERSNKRNKEAKNDCPVYIDGSDVDDVKFAGCCNPIPGDEICAVVSNSGITVHCQSCKNVKYIDEERQLSADWKSDVNKDFFVSLRIVGKDEAGCVGRVIDLIYNSNISLNSVSAKPIGGGNVEIIVGVWLKDKSDVEELSKKLEEMSSIHFVNRNNLN